MAIRTRPAARKRRRKSRDQIDVSALLNKHVTVGTNGREQRMTPFEVSLRAQVKKALKDRSLPAITSVLDVAVIRRWGWCSMCWRASRSCLWNRRRWLFCRGWSR